MFETGVIRGLRGVWLHVSDVDRSVAFYGHQLGLPLTRLNDRVAVTMLPGNVELAIEAAHEGAELQIPGSLGITFEVPDAELAMRSLRDAGVEVDGVYAAPSGDYLYATDPDGYRICLQALRPLVTA